MASKNIVFFDSYSDFSGGAPKSMLNLAFLLKESGEKVNVATLTSGGLESKAREFNVPIVNFNSKKHLLTRREQFNANYFLLFPFLFSILFLWVKVIVKYFKFKGDIFCFNDIRCFVFFFPLLWLRRNDIVWYVRINDRVKFFTKFALFFSKKVILVSSSCKTMFTSDEIKKYEDKLFVLNTGFNVMDNVPVLNSSDSLILGFVGVLSPRKNIELLIDSLSILGCNHLNRIKVLIFGLPKSDNVEYFSIIKKIIKDNGLDENFSFEGHVDSLSDIYTKLDVVILTSYSEGLPRVLLEGLSFGKFLLSVNVDGVSDIIVDNKIGIVAKDYDHNTLSSKIKLLLDDLTYIRSNSKYRMNFVKNNFSEEKFLTGFLNIIYDKRKNSDVSNYNL